MKPEFKENLDKFIDNFVKDNVFSGSVRVSLKGEKIYERFIGNENEEGKPISENSKFAFYSFSKPLCALGLLKLYDKGLISLEDHPKKYLSEITNFSETLTIRHLLTHTSGLPDFEQLTEFSDKYKRGEYPVLRQHLKLLQDYPAYFMPGEGGMYANINFVIPALIIENITGIPYPEYMKKEVFEPLGMETAVVALYNDQVPDMVQGYALSDGKKVPVERWNDWALGAGDIVGRVEDVYCLSKAIKERLLLKDSTWDEVLTPMPQNGMGMGCFVNMWHGKKRILHSGGHKGFRNLHIQILEDDLDIIYMSNCGWGSMREDFAEAIYDAFYGKDDLKSDTVEMDKGYAK